MNLATHNALWNSKRGAAIAAKAVARLSKDELTPVLPHLVPKLFRLSYDVNPRVASAMSSILSTLTDSRKVVPLLVLVNISGSICVLFANNPGYFGQYKLPSVASTH